MDVELPSTGCNIINSSSTFYNYSQDGRTRKTYVIFDGVALLQNQTTAVNPYSYTGTCLSTGDIVYRPELKVYFPLLAGVLFIFSLWVVYRIIFKRLLP